MSLRVGSLLVLGDLPLGFLGMVRGLQFLSAETPGAVNEVIGQVLVPVKSAHGSESTDLMEALADKQSFLEALTRRLAARSPLSDIEFEFAPAPEQTDANVGAERLDDILTTLKPRHDHSSALGKRRLDLYNRTLGWLGGSLECSQHNGSAESVIRLPALQSA
jgi:hypothetical protein